MAVVIFCGPDGAGKSTQVKLLISYLRSKGFRVKGSWIRALHSFALALFRLVIRAGYYRTVSNSYGMSYPLVDFKKLPPLRKLWPYIELLSMLPLLFCRVYLPSKLGWIVVSERLTIDTIPALTWLLEDANFPNSRLARILIGFTPSDSCIVNLECDYNTVLNRRHSTAEPMKFIETQIEIYSDLQRKMPMLTIDTSKHTVEETQALVQNYVMPKIKS